MSRIFFRLRIVFIVTGADDYHMQIINFIFVNYCSYLLSAITVITTLLLVRCSWLEILPFRICTFFLRSFSESSRRWLLLEGWKSNKNIEERSRRTGLDRACQYDVYLYNTAWRLHTFRMGNGLGSFVYQLQCHGLQPWGLCLVLGSSFQYSWTIFRNRDRRQVWIYSNWPSDPGDFVTPRDLLTPPLSGSGGRGVWGVRFALVLNFFMLTVCDQNQRRVNIFHLSIPPPLIPKSHVLSVQKKLCMQNICWVMIMWAGPGTYYFFKFHSSV